MAQHEGRGAGVGEAPPLIERDGARVVLPHGEPDRAQAEGGGFVETALHQRGTDARADPLLYGVESRDLDRLRDSDAIRRRTVAQHRVANDFPFPLGKKHSVPRISLTTGPINALPQADGGGPKSGGLSNAPAYVWFDVAIPTNATHLTFDYELAGDPKEDCLAFAINGTNQFVLTAQFLTPGVMQTTSLLDVSGWAGQTVEFFFGVMGGTSTNATLAVDGLRFYSPQPPKLLAQKLSGQQLVLNWPLSASDYQLERSTSVGTSNGWAVVTNLPAVENFQFALTNSVGSSNTFFRLHRP